MLDKLKKFLFRGNNQIEIEQPNENSTTPPRHILELIIKYEKQYIDDSKKTLDELKSKQLSIVGERLENIKTLTNKHVSKTKKIETLEGLKNSINRSNKEILKYKSILGIRGLILQINGQLEVSKHFDDNSIILEKIINQLKENPNQEISEITELEKNQDLIKEGIGKIAKAEFYTFLADYEENINNLCIEGIDEMIEKIKNNSHIENEYLATEHIKENLIDSTSNTHPLNEIPENLKGLLSIWHDKNDIKNLLSIYNSHKELFEDKIQKKTLMSCFAYTLYEKKWLMKFDEKNVNASELCRIFFKLFNWTSYPKDKDLFNLASETPNFNMKYTKQMKITLRETSIT